MGKLWRLQLEEGGMGGRAPNLLAQDLTVPIQHYFDLPRPHANPPEDGFDIVHKECTDDSSTSSGSTTSHDAERETKYDGCFDSPVSKDSIQELFKTTALQAEVTDVVFSYGLTLLITTEGDLISCENILAPANARLLKLHSTPAKCPHGLPTKAGKRIHAVCASISSREVVVVDGEGALWSLERSALSDCTDTENVVFLRRLSSSNHRCLSLAAGSNFFVAFASVERREEEAEEKEKGEDDEEEEEKEEGVGVACRHCGEENRLRLSVLMREADRAAEAVESEARGARNTTSSSSVSDSRLPSLSEHLPSLEVSTIGSFLDIDNISMKVHRAPSCCELAAPVASLSGRRPPSREDDWLLASPSTARFPRIALLSWGANDVGQLGHGDNIHRQSPCSVSFFERVRICKIAAGDSHAVALSSAATAYVWGVNIAGCDDKSTLTPKLFKAGQDAFVLDVAAVGNSLAILAVDSATRVCNVFLAAGGRPVTRVTSLPKDVACVSVHLLYESLLIRSFDEQELPGVSVWGDGVGFARLLAHLEELGKHCLQEKIKSGSSAAHPDHTAVEAGRLLRRLNKALAKFAHIAAVNAEFVRSEILAIPSSSLPSLYDLLNSGRFRRAFRRFTDAYVTARAYGAFEKMPLSSPAAERYVDLVCLTYSVQSTRPESLIRKLLALPVERLQLINDAFVASTQGENSDAPSGFASLWRHLLAEAEETFSMAQATADFWKDLSEHQEVDLRQSGRLLVARFSLVASSSRRLLSISTTQSSLLSPKYTHVVIFNDVVLFGTKSTDQRYPARLLWLNEGPSSPPAKNPTLSCKTPEETFVVEFDDHDALNGFVRACDFWHWSGYRCGGSGGGGDGSAPSSAADSSLPASHRPPAIRFAKFQFSTGASIISLRGAEYEGEWREAKPNGRGKIVYKDGRTYEGDFEEGLPHGVGVLHHPAEAAPVSSSSFFYVSTPSSLISSSFSAGLINEYRGCFVRGAPHGLVHIRFASGDVYRGYVRNSAPHGFGCMQSRQNSYIGFYVDGKRHGYGVFSQLSSLGTIRSKYFGEFVAGVECGRGTLVDSLGAYHEGVFKEGAIKNGYLQCPVPKDEQGRTAADAFALEYVGDFDGYGYAAGQGTLHVSRSLRISGRFNAVLLGTEGERKKAEEVDIHEARLESVREGEASGDHLRSEGAIESSRVVPIDTRWAPLFSLFVREEIGVEWNRVSVDTVLVAREDGEEGMELVDSGRSRERARAAWKSISQRMSGRESGDVEAAFDQSDAALQPWSASYHRVLTDIWQQAMKDASHPLSRIARAAIEVYQTSYGGPQHRCMYDQAVLELQQLILHVYDVIRLLFPSLPADPFTPLPDESDADVFDSADSDSDADIPSHFSSNVTSPARSNPDELSSLVPDSTAGDFLYAFFFKEVHPCLSPIYLIASTEQDRVYWEKIIYYNAHTDVKLLTLLEVDRSIWPIELENPDDLSATVIRNSARYKFYESAIKTLQNISSESNPFDKIVILIETFVEIDNCKTSFSEAGRSHQWSSDSLFPAFIYVVVRARIQHLGAEIRQIGDFTRSTHEGAVSFMFTNLEAAYNFICTKNLV